MLGVKFRNALADWNRQGRPEGEMFVLGTTGDVLQGLGAMEADIYMHGDKIRTILKEHPEMTLDTIKSIPDIVHDPVLVLSSKGKGLDRNNTRLVLFWPVKAKNGQPILSVLDLRPVEGGFALSDMQKVNSAYTRNNPAAFISTSKVLHVDEKNHTASSFNGLAISSH